MSDFNYEIERTDHYSLVNAILYGESVQDGTPAPDAPVEVQVVEGVNLLNPNSTEPLFINANNGSISALINGYSYVIPCEPSTTYTFARKTAGTDPRYIIAETAVYPASGGTATVLSNRTALTGTVTTTASAKYLILFLNRYTGGEGEEYQLVEGSAALPYTPYGSIGLKIGDTVTPIDLNGNVLASLPDGTKDVLTVDSVGHVVLGKRVAFANPKEAITIGSSSGNQYIATRAPVDGTPTPANENNIIGNRGVAAKNAANVGNMYVTTAGYTIVLVFANNTFASVDEASAWLQANDTYFYYEMATPQTIDLGYIDISHLQDIPAETPISFVTSLTPDSSYSYENNPTYEVKNPYENYNAPEYAYPPNHFGQEWETFDANDWNVSEMLDYTGQPESHAVYTIELCELMQSGAFNWSRPELDWSEAAYDAKQYERFCKYFEQRFMFREISMLPPLQWFTALKRMLVYELMPKYKPLYAQVENGISPLGENEYYKERNILSSYPETLLSGNSDYISSGEDREFERIKIDNAAEALEAYRNGFRSVDAALGDELEILFISMYTSFVNAF